MKITISIPDLVFQAGEHLAQQLKVSRSQLYSDALAAYLASRRVTAQLDAVYSSIDSTLGRTLTRAQIGSLDGETW